MPLKNGSNIRMMMKEGKPSKQAIAIAMQMRRKGKK